MKEVPHGAPRVSEGLQRCRKDATEAEDKHAPVQDLASRMDTFLKGWRKELPAHKNFLDQEA